MFNKKNDYILTLTDRGELRLEDFEKKNQIENILLDPSVYFDDKIYDPIQFSYIINKLLSDISSNSNILIRYASKDNIFRVQSIVNLSPEEIDGYIEYNMDDILPFSKENLIIKNIYKNEMLYVFAMNKEIVSFFKDNLSNFGYKNIYLTTYSSELISYILTKNIRSGIFLNIEKYGVEAILIKNFQIINYRNRIIDEKIDYSNLEIGNSQYEILKNEITKTFEDISEYYKSIEYVPIFVSGDWNIIKVWEKVIFDEYNKNVENLYFNISKYFEVN